MKEVAREEAVKRVCIQAVNYLRVFDDVLGLASEVWESSKLPISISCQPLDKGKMEQLANAGVDRISVPLDGASEEVFEAAKGSGVGSPYSWKGHWKALEAAVQVFGRGRVTTHLIVGLGETDRDLVQVMQRLVNMGVHPSLFAFTPIPGTLMGGRPRPSISRYRRVQVAQYLVTHGMVKQGGMRFDDGGDLVDFGVSKEDLSHVIGTGEPFTTSGCPGCNRPFYNESPRGPFYNYPSRPNVNDITTIRNQLCDSGSTDD